MFDSLSDEQREAALNRSGKFVLRACPGSGKTYTVAARVANQLLKWKGAHTGIATLSFTNVACKEINEGISNFGVSNEVTYPHFIGTIDSFINQHIFLPFGHLVMKCSRRPEMVGEPHRKWYHVSGSNFRAYKPYFHLFSYNLDDEVIAIGPTTECFFGNQRVSGTGHENHIKRAKETLFREGYANQADANYFAVKVLEQYPVIAKALVKRFPAFNIDEGQDTSAIHMRIIDLLLNAGLKELMLVGDPDQAIYEWNDAEPSLFMQKEEEWLDNSISINENRRSGQNLCNATFNLSSLSSPSKSIANVTNSELLLVSYDKEGESYLAELQSYFTGQCSASNMSPSSHSLSILTRSKELRHRILNDSVLPPVTSPWVPGDKFSENFIKGCYFYDNNEFRTGFNFLASAVLSLYKKRRSEVDEIKFRTFVENLRKDVPKVEGVVREWISRLPKLQVGTSERLVQVEDTFLDLDFSQLNLGRRTSIKEGILVSTIHGVKGETHDASMVILAGGYKSALKNKKAINEKLRVAYVALTRPKILSVLAVPKTDAEEWATRLSVSITKHI